MGGEKFNRLLIVGFSHYDKKRRKFIKCLCDCGKETIAAEGKVKSGHTKSCGCYKKERIPFFNLKHGMNGTPEYHAWHGMMTRCYNKNVWNFERYGGRGISVCDRWRLSFNNFILDMGKRPTPSHSLDRVNNNGNYEPNNLRWATKKEQNRNTSRNTKVVFNGIEKPLIEWCEKLNINYATLKTQRHRTKKSHQEMFDHYAPKNTFISHTFSNINA